jgi:RimJ/RimL family protein N-acetyltransferase
VIILETERLRVRNWVESDRPLFAEINADPKVMEFFPRRRPRDESDALMDEVRTRIDATGLGFFALALKETDEPIGFSALPAPGLSLS